MITRSYSTEGIVLARRNYSEADRILSVYTKSHGRVSLLAKGVRKPASKKRGHLEIFSHIKFSASKGKGLDLITEAELINSYSKIRKDLNKVSVAYFFVEAVGRITREGEKNEEVFELLLDRIRNLEDSPNLRKLREGFIQDLLVTLGFWPKGKVLDNPDQKLEEILERNLLTIRVGRKLLS